MKKDSSMMLLNKYFTLSDRRIELRLKNGQVRHGIIAGFFYGQECVNRRSVHMWRFVPDEEAGYPGYAGIEFKKGILVRHREILRITFYADNSTMEL